jgi:2-C-methyl-D-erythritol 4-phosphate cytidylyltransferase
MARDKYLIIMAGGSGSRMGGPLPKQFMDLSGAPDDHGAFP